MLFDRDFRTLTAIEEAQLKKAKKVIEKRENGISPAQLFRYDKLMPLAGYHFESLFPNNYLHIDELKDHQRLDTASEQLTRLLESDHSERDILNFINSNKYYFIIGAILKSSFNFGHHKAYAFKEFELPPNYVADYLLVGKNSSGHHFVFVELENATGSIVNQDGSFGTTIRKGQKQIEDWDEWIDGNYSHLRLLFQKYIGTHMPLPPEFITLDKTRIHYAIIAGRRKHFKEKTYRLQRKLKLEQNITLLHYDNLIDTIQLFKSSGNY